MDCALSLPTLTYVISTGSYNKSADKLRGGPVVRQQGGKFLRVAARHTAFSADPIDARVTAGGGEPRRVASVIFAVDESKIQGSLGIQI